MKLKFVVFNIICIICELQASSRQARNALRDHNRLWPNGIIPYTISSNFNNYEVNMILAAMADIQQKTCIRFQPKTSSHWDYLDIIRGTGCSADVGRKGGRQELNLDYDCFTMGVVLHELMHTIGFLHEHTRPDRDKYVKIIWNNINPDNEYNFHILPQNFVQNLGEKYDTGSIMHYGPNYFAKNLHQLNIIPVDPNQRITVPESFSNSDLRQINKLYQCRTGVY